MNTVPMWTIENKHRGHWFSPGAKRFFSSRIAAYGYENTTSNLVYFVSSERNGYTFPRRYTVRVYNPTTDQIDTIGDFQQYASRNGADKAARRAAL